MRTMPATMPFCTSLLERIKQDAERGIGASSGDTLILVGSAILSAAILSQNARLIEQVAVLRKDSESYRLLSFCHGQGTLELVKSYHELCTEIRRLKILAGEPVPPTLAEFVGPRAEGLTARIRRKIAAMSNEAQPSE